MRHVLESIVGVPAPIPIAPPQRPSTKSLVVDELGEFMFGVTRRVAEVRSALDKDDGVAFEPIKVCQVRPDMHWDAVAKLVERSLDPREFEFWNRHCCGRDAKQP